MGSGEVDSCQKSKCRCRLRTADRIGRADIRFCGNQGVRGSVCGQNSSVSALRTRVIGSEAVHSGAGASQKRSDLPIDSVLRAATRETQTGG
jgi:hypothetical protein